MGLGLESLPLELILHVFSFLSSRTLLRSVALVCSGFFQVIHDGGFWRRRLVAMLGHTEQRLHRMERLRDWQLACAQLEFGRAARRSEVDKDITLLKDNREGVLDCVHVLRPEMHGTSAVIAAGSRDYTIWLWRRRASAVTGGRGGGGGERGEDTSDSTCRRTIRRFTTNFLTGHNGWVWCLTSCPVDQRLLYSGSMDGEVKLWDVCVSKDICTVPCVKRQKAAVLSMVIPEPNVLVCGSADRSVRVFDVRSPVSLAFSHEEHRSPVLSVAANERYIFSGSAGKCVGVWDRRANKRLQMLRFHFSEGTLAMSSSDKTVSLWTPSLS